MIVTFSLADSPIGVSPSVGLDEFHASGHGKVSHEVRMLRELGPEDFLHRFELDVFPVGPERDVLSYSFGSTWSGTALDHGPVFRVEALGCLIGVF